MATDGKVTVLTQRKAGGYRMVLVPGRRYDVVYAPKGINDTTSKQLVSLTEAEYTTNGTKTVPFVLFRLSNGSMRKVKSVNIVDLKLCREQTPGTEFDREEFLNRLHERRAVRNPQTEAEKEARTARIRAWVAERKRIKDEIAERVEAIANDPS